MDETQGHPEPGASELLAKYLRRPGILLPLLGLVTFVVYSGSLSFEFVWDDWPQIVNSPIIRTWSNLPRAFGSDLWYHVARHQVYYRPLFVAWSMLNYTLFGLRPWGWHLGAVLLHVGAVAAVFWLARRLGLEYWTAALAALIFALHPIHIEPVTWISAASDTMVTMFAALAFAAFLNARDPERNPASEKKRTAWWIASLALLACALLTKEMAVVFSALVGIYAWLHPARKRRHRLGTETSWGGDGGGSVRGGDASLRAAAKARAAALRLGSSIPVTGCWMWRGLCRWCCPSICGSCWFRWALRGSITPPMLRAQSSVKWWLPAAVAGGGAGWVVVLESARREFHRCVCGIVAAGWAGAGAVFAKLWQRRFRARPLHVFALDRICDSGGNGLAAVAVHQGVDARGSAGVRGAGAVQWLCVRFACTAGVLGKRSAAAGARTSSVSGNPYAVAGLAKEYSQTGCA